MIAYAYNAALYCEQCGNDIRDRIRAEVPRGYHSEDSTEWPQRDDDGGGEADCPQHCDACHEFLENPLTTDGREYVLAAHHDNHSEITKLWVDFYDLHDDDDDDDE